MKGKPDGVKGGFIGFIGFVGFIGFEGMGRG